MAGQIETPTNETDSGASILTPRAQQVMEFARKESEQLNHNFVGTEHLLLGLLRLDVSTAVKVLKSLGVDLDVARAEVKKELPSSAPLPNGQIVHVTPRLTKVVASAKAYAKRFQHRYIGTEHLLLGLLAEDDRSLAGRILIRRFGLNLAELRTALEKELERGLGGNESKP